MKSLSWAKLVEAEAAVADGGADVGRVVLTVSSSIAAVD
jgi:hypothetical protein